MKNSVAFLTGGGCAPGLDPFIQTFSRLLLADHEVYGILCGCDGLVHPGMIIQELMDEKRIAGLSRSGGTDVKTSRINPFSSMAMRINMQRNYQEARARGLQGIVVFGGDDTLKTAALAHEQLGMNIISVPKTMDLDLNSTDYSVGFHAYCEAVFRNAVEGFIVTLKAHQRIGVLEVFGRNSGFTAAQIGLAADACFIAIPEMEIDLDLLKERVQKTYNRDNWGLVVVAEAINIEGADVSKIDPHGNEFLSQRRVGDFMAVQIEVMTGIESRAFQATHPFRGVPTAYDAVMGIRLGMKAAEMVRNDQWNQMILIKNDEIITTDNLWAFEPRRVITPDSWWWEAAELRNHGLI